MIRDEDFLSVEKVLTKLKEAADKQRPFSLVRIGDGENFILTQDSVWTMRQVFNQKWAVLANMGRKGITLPNLALRDQIVEAVKKADVVGILPHNENCLSNLISSKNAVLHN
jgi:hypothetical protein